MRASDCWMIHQRAQELAEALWRYRDLREDMSPLVAVVEAAVLQTIGEDHDRLTAVWEDLGCPALDEGSGLWLWVVGTICERLMRRCESVRPEHLGRPFCFESERAMVIATGGGLSDLARCESKERSQARVRRSGVFVSDSAGRP